jgi:putative addiction module component (TIGR02574 family)
MNTTINDILRLSVAERIQLAEDIWDSVVAFPEALPVTDLQKQELDQRLQAYRKNPSEGIAWRELKDRLMRSNDV